MDYKIPVFSSSSMRYMSNIDDIVRNQSIGNILGAESSGGNAFGVKGIKNLGEPGGMAPLLKEIVKLFQSSDAYGAG